MAEGKRIGGRQKGTPNRASIATWERIEGEADPIGFLTAVMKGEAIEAAVIKDGGDSLTVTPTLDQRLTAASQLSRWMPPPPRVRPLMFDVPKMETSADIVAAMACVLAAMAAGEITPDEAKAVAEVVEMQRRAIETEDLERRIGALEANRA